MSEPRIPTEVSHDELLTAMKPFWELLNVDPNEVTGDITFVSSHDEGVNYYIRFNVVARDEDDDGTYEIPLARKNDEHPNDEFACWEHRVEVATTSAPFA